MDMDDLRYTTLHLLHSLAKMDDFRYAVYLAIATHVLITVFLLTMFNFKVPTTPWTMVRPQTTPIWVPLSRTPSPSLPTPFLDNAPATPVQYEKPTFEIEMVPYIDECITLLEWYVETAQIDECIALVLGGVPAEDPGLLGTLTGKAKRKYKEFLKKSAIRWWKEYFERFKPWVFDLVEVLENHENTAYNPVRFSQEGVWYDETTPMDECIYWVSGELPIDDDAEDSISQMQWDNEQNPKAPHHSKGYAPDSPRSSCCDEWFKET
ncbi:uncharacterized protein PAC_13029 [Phialocephala subalpina]|uniref:Uncharacterized protein n=1 Tax=Phialocephala subalpina TaxID=576137 RepID=A0A1L7XDN7_9HELO|nr:uncharacterized protein PAC_13029 [Phialocephala subalpina]